MAHIPIETGKVKNARGTRVIGYWARLGDVTERADTQPEAVSKLQSRLEAMARYSAPARVKQFCESHKYTVILCPEFDRQGTHVLTICPDGSIQQSAAVETDFEKLFHSAALHIAQMHWSIDPSEAKALVQGTGKEREFDSWITFQEAYRDARASGLNDIEAHKLACEASWTTHK